MKAMVLTEISAAEKGPLEMIDLPKPVPGPKEILVKISEYYLVLWASIVTGFVTWFVAILNVDAGKRKGE